MPKKGLFSADGIAHQRIAQGERPYKVTKGAEFGAGFSKEVAEVCLKCTKKKCNGGHECYINRKKEAKK